MIWDLLQGSFINCGAGLPCKCNSEQIYMQLSRGEKSLSPLSLSIRIFRTNEYCFSPTEKASKWISRFRVKRSVRFCEASKNHLYFLARFCNFQQRCTRLSILPVHPGRERLHCLYCTCKKWSERTWVDRVTRRRGAWFSWLHGSPCRNWNYHWLCLCDFS